MFFRPAAFQGSSGETFLDRVWAESETAAQQPGADLQDNVFTALGVLGTGFAATNELRIDPDTTARLDELKEQSLVLLCRLMFVLYAESRDLIDPDDAHTTEYEENFSLDRLRREIVSEVGDAATERAFEREYSTYSTGTWSRLTDFFGLIDEGNESLGIPPHNGGLSTRRPTTSSSRTRSPTGISRRSLTDSRPLSPKRGSSLPSTPTWTPGT